MSNLNKKILLFVMLVGLTLGLVGCSNPDNSVRIRFPEEEYEIRMHETKVIEPTIIKSSQVGDVELAYSSSDESVVKVVDGVLVPVSIGEATVKVEWANKDIIFDKVTVKVIKASLPQAILNFEAAMLKNDTQTVSVSLGNNYTEAAYTINALTPEIATVEGDVITAVAVGEAKFEVVVADYEDSETYEFSVKVEESDFAIKYNLDGGKNHDENPLGYNTLKLPLPLKEASKLGYTFLGWYHEGEKVEAIPAGTLGDYEVTAHWQINEYTISYAGIEGASFNDGYALPQVYTVESDDITVAAPEKLGYTFLGWYANDQKVEKIAKGSTGNVELVAKWETIQYEVKYDADGGDLGVQLYTYDTIISDYLADFNRIGGTNLDPAGYAKNSSSAIKVVMANAEFLTKWAWLFEFAIEDLKAANPDATSAYLLDVYPALEESLKGESAIFTGGSGANARTMIRNYIGGMLQKQKGCSSNATFQAYATDFSDAARQAALVAAANAGKDFKFTVEDEVQLVVPTKLGYAFKGWYNANDEKVEKVEKGTAANVELKAKWEIEVYNINYQLEGGSFDGLYASHEQIVAEFLKDFGAYAGVEMTTPAEYWSAGAKTSFWKNAEMHAKWSWIFKFLSPLAKEQGQSTEYLDNMNKESVTVSGYATQNVAIFLLQINNAQWNETYKATYGGLPSKWTTVDCTAVTFADYAAYLPECFHVLSTDFTVEEEVALETPVLFDHIFLGWYNAAGEKVEKVAKGTAEDVTFTAKWHKIIRYSLTWNLEGGQWEEGKEGAELFVEGEYASVVLPTPVKKYHAFLGWYNAAGEKVEALTADQEYVLTAKWQDLRINGGTQFILFQLEGGDWKEGQIPGVDVTDYVEVLKLIPAKEGYAFKEWEVQSDNDTDPVTVIYTAIWEPTKVYTISYVLNEGVNAESNPAQFYETQLPLTLAPATREGYKFVGWFDGETQVEVITVAVDITLEARWESTTVVVEFDLAGGEMQGNAPEFAAVAEELLADYNEIAETSFNATNFAKESSKTIKIVMADAGFLTKWAWFFTFAIEDLKAANPDATSAYLTDVYPALEESLKGESAIFTGGDGANARTMFRNYMGGLFLHSKGCPSNAEFQKYATDFSDPARQAALVAAAPQSYVFELQIGDALPTPEKEGYVFKGWYDAADQLVAVATASGKLTAKWEEEQVGPFAISYDLDGGQWANAAPTTHEEIKTLFLADMLAYLQSLGQEVEEIDPVDQKEEHLTDFFGISYAKRDDIPAFFLTHEVYSARWKWMYDYVLAVSGADFSSSTVVRSNIHGFVYSTIKEKWPVSHDFSSVNFNDYKDLLPAALGAPKAGPAEYAYGAALELPTPVKEGAEFAGWTLNGEAFAGITETTKGDLALVATWK